MNFSLTVSALLSGIVAVLASSSVNEVAAASFDCTKAAQPIEKLICGSDELGALDSAIAWMYQAKGHLLSSEQKKDLLRGQREWLGKRITECHVPEVASELTEFDAKTTSCVATLYRERFKEIFSLGAKPAVGQEADELYVKGQKEYRALHYAAALSAWNKAAALGSGKAMSAIGDLYDFGVGVREDHITAMNWWLKASDARDTGAMLSIATSYSRGVVRPRDMAQVSKWVDEAAVSGDSRGLTAKANAFLTNNKFLDAVVWFRLSADEGNADSMLQLCRLYRQGRGVSRDAEQAQLWCDKAKGQLSARANGGEISAMKELGNFLLQGDDPRGGIEWLTKAGELGDADAAYSVANVYDRGNLEYSVSANAKLASAWRTKAADLMVKRASAGDVQAMIFLGQHVVGGKGIAQSCGTRLDWLKHAADRGSNEAMRYLGAAYYDGECTDVDYGNSRYWLSKAVSSGDQMANDILEKLSHSE